MKHKLLWLGLAIAVLTEGGVVPQPVLVELFTSEGCSSCPPADALLEKLERDQPVAGAHVIVLSEHVDYWNHLGWTDPFSSPRFSERQQSYARRFGLSGPYTPEMVVDGTAEFVGSDARKAEQAIRTAAGEAKANIRIEASEVPDSVTIVVDPLPAPNKHKANVYLASAADTGSSDVVRGENQGRKLRHVSIARDIQQVGSIGYGERFEKVIRVNNASRLIAFVQEPGNGRVWGAALLYKPLPRSVPSSK